MSPLPRLALGCLVGLALWLGLILLAAGDTDAASVRRGFERVQRLKQEMATGRKARLVRLGFPVDEADRLSGLHTRNFM